MANKNKYYCIIGVDHEDKSWDCNIPYSLEARLYDLDTSSCLGKLSLRLAEHGDSNLEEHLSNWCYGITKRICYQFMLFHGLKLKDGDICRLLINRAPTLKIRNYYEGHHHKLTIFDKDKYTKWKVVPDTLFDFDFTSDKGHNESEFDKFCDFMIARVGISNFCKKNTSSQQLLRSQLAPKLVNDNECADVNPVSSSTATLEYDMGMNSGGRFVCRHPYQDIPVIGVDVNSLYTQMILEKTFSRTKLRKISPFSNYDYSQPWVWDTYKKTLDGMYGENAWQMRVWIEVEDAILKDVKNPMRMHDSYFADSKIPSIRRYAAEYARFSGQTMFFFDEIVEFLQKYNVFGFKVRLMLHTFCSKFSKSVREYAYSLFRDAKAKKKDPNQAASSKILKNTLAGFFEMNPAKYVSDAGLSDNMWDAQVQARFVEGRKHGNYSNILAGSEITLHGRNTHKSIEKFFADRGFETVYGNTDSLYLACLSDKDREGIYKAIEEFNQCNYVELKKHCGHFHNWVEMSPKDAVGGLKIEFEGRIVHGGANKIFKADKKGLIYEGSISGYNVVDILKPGESRRIEDMVEGRVIKDVLIKRDKATHTALEVIDWKF